MPNRWVTSVLATVLLATACGGGTSLPGPAVVTFPISALGAEGQVLVRQLARFMKENPGIKVVQRVTPDAADRLLPLDHHGQPMAGQSYCHLFLWASQPWNR